MDLFFNELSIKGKDEITVDSVIAIAKVYKELIKYHITTCRISSEDNTRLFQMIGNMPNSINVKNFYFSFFRSPYESEEVEQKQEEYYKYSWSYQDEECLGFALAILFDSASFSIYSKEWDIPLIEFLKDTQRLCARNICTKEHIDFHLPQLQGETQTELLLCDISISEKKINLRQDHGMDVLREYSKRLIRCPYVIEVVNSLPFNPYERKFIRKIRENGLIEIVLPWTDEKFGLVVRTTGRTVGETKRIAEIIEREFGYI